ncbi:MAG TPA: hypothetical protein VFA97_09140 [Gaiellaceae bacterium]|nr:hypothetical protein [Gaiellaceae bacterium]
MTKVDQTVDRAADKLDGFVRSARAAGGVKAKLGDALAEDPAFLRKLKPSLIAARAKGRGPASDNLAQASPAAPTGPQHPPAKKRGGPNPWLVVGAALVTGYAVAKLIDWRGHAHPRA